MSQPITLYLIGFSGTGKYTIAKEIAKSEYKIVDNHLINNPIFSLLDLDGITPIPENAWASIEGIRKIVLDFVSRDKKTNYVFTNELYEVDHDRLIYARIKGAAEKRGSLFVPVKLIISSEERERRIVDPDRITRFKSINPKEVRIKQEFIKIDHPHLLELDVTHLSPTQATAEILNKLFAIESKKLSQYLLSKKNKRLLE